MCTALILTTSISMIRLSPRGPDTLTPTGTNRLGMHTRTFRTHIIGTVIELEVIRVTRG